jgi:hypothetical protein
LPVGNTMNLLWAMAERRASRRMITVDGNSAAVMAARLLSRGLL